MTTTIRPERLAALRMERDAAARSVVDAEALRRSRLAALRDLGRMMAAERLSYLQAQEIMFASHTWRRAPALVPGIDVQTETEWFEFCRGVGDVMHLV